MSLILYKEKLEEVVSIDGLLAEAKTLLNSDLARALDLSTLALEIATRADAASKESDVRHFVSQAYFMQGNNLKAIEEVKRAIEIREELQETLKLAASLNSLGIFLDTIGDYSGALEAYFASLRAKEELNDKKGIANTLINIGSVYCRLNNTERELKMYERSLKIANEIGDTKTISYNHLNLGLLYTRTGDYDLALKYLDNIEDVLTGFGDMTNAKKAVLSQGNIYKKRGEYARAIESFSHFLKISERAGDVNAVAVSLLNIAEVKLLTNELEEAKELAERADRISLENSIKECHKDALHVFSEYYERKGKYKEALDIYKTYVEAKDDMLNIHNLKLLEELHLKYDLDKNEKEAEIHQLKNVELKQALDGLVAEKERSDSLLRNILPDEIAEELKVSGTSKARYFDQVTIMFIDIKNFTIISQRLSPQDLVNEIDFLFRKFDQICNMFGLEKIKTIGDAYMCAGGIPIPDTSNAENVADAALLILEFMDELKEDRDMSSKPFFEIRIGVNTGPVVAGIVGSSKFAYDIWGDAVNTAARMEQTSEVGQINISGNTYELLKDKFNCTYRGKVNAKNKGEIDMYFLKGRKNL